MADVFSAPQRSRIMAAVKSTGNRSTELTLVCLLKESEIKGWRRKQDLPGKPDFVFRKPRVAVFVDGCFWHGCTTCYREPKSRREYWRNKIERNVRRDRKVARILRSKGWAVIRVKECELRKRPGAVARRIARILGDRDGNDNRK